MELSSKKEPELKVKENSQPIPIKKEKKSTNQVAQCLFEKEIRHPY
jgi:hypothetical protein